MGLVVEQFPVGLLQCNCTILGDSDSGQAMVIDPGDDAPRILSRLEARGLNAVFLVHTHAHLDHVGGTAGVKSATDARTCLHEGDLFLYEDVEMQARMIGLPPPPAPPAVDHWLQDDEEIAAPGFALKVLHTPGHTPGSCSFRLEHPQLEAPLLFSGDTLFQQSIGRTDLPGGNLDQLLDSIHASLLSLSANTVVVPGHGPNTTIAREKATNPFLQDYP